MKMYLSSYKFGDHLEDLRQMVPKNNKIAQISNALDSQGVDLERRKQREEEEAQVLRSVGFQVVYLDLRDYFGKENELRNKMNEFGGVWINGGNVFVLRQAMALSGFDTIVHELNQKKDFLYAGYSAGPCVLSPTLDGYHIVDDSTEAPYFESQEILWDGLGITDWVFLPHFESDHPESEDISKELEYLKNKSIPYKTLRDGEVVIIK